MARVRTALNVPFAVELALDESSAEVVRAVWRALAADGFAFMAQAGAHPHISLAIWEEIALTPLAAALGTFAAETSSVPVAFSRVDVFPSTGVVFLAPELNGDPGSPSTLPPNPHRPRSPALGL